MKTLIVKVTLVSVLLLSSTAYSQSFLTVWDVRDIVIQKQTFSGTLNRLTLDMEFGRESNISVYGRALIGDGGLSVPAYGSAFITSGGTGLVVHITVLEYQLQFSVPGGQAILLHVPTGTTPGNGSVTLREVR